MNVPEDNSIQLNRPIVAIVGPTASGKTDLAQELAVRLDAAIVSADSMQVYKGMDIGTGKLPESERRVEHYGLDLCEPYETYSVAEYQRYARDCFRKIDSIGKRIVLCGGTGLYIGAALYDFRFPKGEQLNNEVRDHYTHIAEAQGSRFLWDMLNEADPESAELIHPHNVRRVVRAFEMLSEGTSYAEQNKNAKQLPAVVPNIQIGLSVTPELLNKKIDARVDDMMSSGLIKEVEHLMAQGLRESLTSPQAIGYKEIVDALEGDCTIDEAVDAIKRTTRRYAKRQRTWFRRDPRIRWISVDSKTVQELAAESMSLIKEYDMALDRGNGM